MSRVRLQLSILLVLVVLSAMLAGCGSYGSSATTMNSPTVRFTYVTNSADNTVSIFAVDGNGSQLRLTGSVATGGTNPISVTADATGHVLYVVNFGSNDIPAFSIDAATGALTAIGGPVAAGVRPRSFVVDPNGRFAYAVNQS